MFGQKTKDGYELTWAVNVMAPFLLTSLLLDNITERIVNVSSISAGSSLDFNNLQQVSSAHVWRCAAHSSSVLALLRFLCRYK